MSFRDTVVLPASIAPHQIVKSTMAPAAMLTRPLTELALPKIPAVNSEALNMVVWASVNA
jgi:hypothetical protein